MTEKNVSHPIMDRTAARTPPPRPRGASQFLANLVAVYGLLVVFLLIMLIFGLLRPSSFFSATNINAILVGQSVTAILALAEMIPLATKQFDLSIGYHLGMAQSQAGDNSEARDNLMRAVQSGTRFSGLEEARATLDRLAKLPSIAASTPKT